MPKRLQIVVSDEEMERIRKQALSQGLSVDSLVRCALGLGPTPVAKPDGKLAALHAMARDSQASADLRRMIPEVEGEE